MQLSNARTHETCACFLVMNYLLPILKTQNLGCQIVQSSDISYQVFFLHHLYFWLEVKVHSTSYIVIQYYFYPKIEIWSGASLTFNALALEAVATCHVNWRWIGSSIQVVVRSKPILEECIYCHILSAVLMTHTVVQVNNLVIPIPNRCAWFADMFQNVSAVRTTHGALRNQSCCPQSLRVRCSRFVVKSADLTWPLSDRKVYI